MPVCGLHAEIKARCVVVAAGGGYGWQHEGQIRAIYHWLLSGKLVITSHHRSHPVQVPPGGVALSIHRSYHSTDHLPSASTCFNQLLLPKYPSKQKLQERLVLALTEGAGHFGVA